MINSHVSFYSRKLCFFFATELQWHHWTKEDLAALILAIVEKREKLAHTLATAFYIFDPVSQGSVHFEMYMYPNTVFMFCRKSYQLHISWSIGLNSTWNDLHVIFDRFLSIFTTKIVLWRSSPWGHNIVTPFYQRLGWPPPQVFSLFFGMQMEWKTCFTWSYTLRAAKQFLPKHITPS